MIRKNKLFNNITIDHKNNNWSAPKSCRISGIMAEIIESIIKSVALNFVWHNWKPNLIYNIKRSSHV